MKPESSDPSTYYERRADPSYIEAFTNAWKPFATSEAQELLAEALTNPNSVKQPAPEALVQDAVNSAFKVLQEIPLTEAPADLGLLVVRATYQGAVWAFVKHDANKQLDSFVYKVARRSVWDADAVDDVAQNARRNLLQRRSGQPRGSIRAYVAVAVRNTVWDTIGEERPHWNVSLEESGVDRALLDDLYEADAPLATPDDAAMDAENQRLLDRVLPWLTPKDRDLILQRWETRKSPLRREEYAAALEAKEEAYKKRLQRARPRMTAMLAVLAELPDDANGLLEQYVSRTPRPSCMELGQAMGASVATLAQWIQQAQKALNAIVQERGKQDSEFNHAVERVQGEVEKLRTVLEDCDGQAGGVTRTGLSATDRTAEVCNELR